MKILSYQGTPYSGNIEKNISTINTVAEAAKTLNVDVIVFPELFVTGYNIGDEMMRLAQPLTGDLVHSLQKIAKKNSVAIITGFPESEEDRIFNSCVAINQFGNIAGHHRKVFLYGEKEKEIFCKGDEFKVFDLHGYHCGMSVCYDIEFPEAVRDLVKKGAEVIFNPTANMAPYIEIPQTLARARALENGVVVVYANLCGEENGMNYTGLSAIISPEGLDLARAGQGEAILISDISESVAANKINPVSDQLKELRELNFTVA